MLTKMVNGKQVVLSDEEEKNTLAYWKLNEVYPEYSGCCAFDGVKPAYHIIDDCKVIHMGLIEKARQRALNDLRDIIESAEEDGLDCSKYYAERKEIKSATCDLNKCSSVDEIRASVPDCLKDSFLKE